MDLIVRGGDVVTVGGRAVVDVGIRDGVIAQLGGAMTAGTGGTEIDATGRVLTPGGVDAHVHLTDPIRGDPDWHWSDDFESGTQAALAGGITTVGNMSFPPRDGTIADAIEQDDADARALAVTDYFLHPVLMRATEENLACIGPLHEAGHTSIKFFLSFNHFDRHVPSPTRGPCSPRWWPRTARSGSPKRRGVRATSSTSRAPGRWRPATADGAGACRSTSRPARSTCT